jgi:glyoxylase-like metal-dependent hydrolase (beta-lactamase superfamily II)
VSRKLPEPLSTIIISHYHPDHIFGLMAKDTNAQIFPNAEIIVPAAEHKWWTDQSVFTKLPEARHGLAKRIQATIGNWKNVKQIEPDKEVAPGITSVSSYGHTPGHTSFRVASGKKQLIVLGDVTNIPALFAKNPGWHAAFDTDAAMAGPAAEHVRPRHCEDHRLITTSARGRRRRRDGAATCSPYLRMRVTAYRRRHASRALFHATVVWPVPAMGRVKTRLASRSARWRRSALSPYLAAVGPRRPRSAPAASVIGDRVSARRSCRAARRQPQEGGSRSPRSILDLPAPGPLIVSARYPGDPAPYQTHSAARRACGWPCPTGLLRFSKRALAYRVASVLVHRRC